MLAAIKAEVDAALPRLVAAVTFVADEAHAHPDTTLVLIGLVVGLVVGVVI